MANNDQNEPSLPTSANSKRTASNLLPRFYRTDSNKKFLQATVDQLTQPGTVKKVNGFIGRQNAKSVSASDIFISATDKTRQDYQLEPSAIIQDELGNINFYKDYIDHINHIDVFGGVTANHEKLNKQEFYSWDPHICWDKFVNYQNYYWLPYGPTPIEVAGQQNKIESTYNVSAVDEGDNYAFLFTPNGLTKNPTLTLYRGQTYNFVVSSQGNPFSIKSSRVAGIEDRYSEGITNNGTESGTLTFIVGENTPDVLYYVSENSVDTGGVLHILDIDENTYLDVEADLLGKQTYKMSNGSFLSNGMKIKFIGNITPAKYAQGYWYVEGVGEQISLVSEADLEIIGNYTEEVSVLFDDTPFDKDPFSSASAYPSSKDYILINRASPDRNPWSRFNRWFHQDVIKVSAELSGQVPEYDQTARAVRPIIEFDAGLKLYNFGHKAKLNVDLIDTFTTDVFSTIEGTLGYNIDGVDVADGMRVLFSADTDARVKNKIYKVNFITVTNPGRVVDFTPLNNIDSATSTITFSTAHSFLTGNRVTYLNNGNTSISGLTNRNIYYVQVVNETKIKLFTDKFLTTQVTLFASGSGTHSFESYSGARRQINLVEDTDATPNKNETVLIKLGNINQGLMYWFNGSNWILGQTKTTSNQPPLFDIFDNNGNSYSDISVYDGSTFAGTKVFSYKVGTTFVDTALGFPLTYQNIDNIGDIVFEFNLVSDSFNYKQVTNIISETTDVGFLKLVTTLTDYSYVNGWKISKVKNAQPIVRIFKESQLTNDFPIDVYDNLSDLADLEVRVYINGKRLARSLYSVQSTEFTTFVRLTNSVTTSDVVTLKCFANQEKNNNGYYEVPINLQNNPLNDNLITFTLGQVIDHVGSIIDNIQTFTGTYPGYGNLRDIGNLSEFGTKFVQHSAPLNMSLYHLGSQNANAFKAIDQARKDYGKFKRTFIIAASTSGIDTDPKRHVDFILSKLTSDRPKTQPYYVSDMFGFSGNTRLEYLVLDARIKKYPLTQTFNLEKLSNKAVNIYLNGDQLVHGRDYIFSSTDVFFEILVDLKEDDLIEAYEYDSTDGTYCPPTPTKLGLYPAYEPRMYLDTSYDIPTMVVQGHDGSITIAFNDYRDELILELEKRIFNNLKTKYDDSIINIFDYIPGYDRITDFSVKDTNRILSQFFFDWTSNISQDYTKQINFNRLDPFKLNYRGTYSPKGTDLPASWRGIYKWYLDTDCPHLVPWESLGFTIKPVWWDNVYGTAPYTSNNQLMWEDIKNGIIREPNKPVRRVEKYARSILEKGVPVDQTGNLKNPVDANFVDGYINETAGYYEFGDGGPVETAWRRSSYYSYALLQTALLLNPNKILSLGFDRSRVVRNLANQFVYKDTGLRIKLSNLILPSTALSSTRVLTAGIVNFIIDYMTSDTASRIETYADDLQLLTNRLGSKLGGFTSKPKFKLLLDSKNPKSTSGVFVPEENYNVFLNTSSPTQKLVYSGVVITKYDDGFEIRGYNNEDPYFKYYQWIENDRVINVGGISESFINWEENQLYTAGKIVAYGNYYYRVTVGHTSTTTFQSAYYTKLPALPIIGGKDVVLRKSWDTSEELILAYGVKLGSVQEVADFMQGYGAYLESKGFIFDDFSANLKVVSNWETSVKEFLFWSTQNWAQGAVLSLSPSADRLVLKTTNAVVNNIQDEFFEYKIFRVDGLKLEPEFTSTYRDSGEFNLSPIGTNHGIYCAVLYLVQKEHVVVLDNRTLFNDIIYDLEPGYRQEKIKVLGYLSRDWSGGFNIPGFTFDQARIQDWEPWTDYNLGDIVKYKEFYYTAKSSLPGVSAFNSEDWALQRSKPTSSMKPNWDYRAEQFTDYYDLDTDNFDTTQQKFGQHLIGYQKRQYLENIIKDDVSQYKFYQGMIIEKGTQNVLSKLFDVLGADNTDSLTFNEEWAVRVGNYGSTNAFDEIEFTLDESQFKISPQPIELVSTIDPTIVDFVYRQTPNNLYIKPIGYNNNPWPTEGTKTFLRTPGYVRYEDVNWPVSDLADFQSRDTSAFADGEYVWCGFESRDWNVYRITRKDVSIISSSYSSSTDMLTLGTASAHGLAAGTIIGLKISDVVSGFYKIETTPNSSTIVIKLKPSSTITGFENSTYIYTLNSSRIDNIDNANSVLNHSLKENELLWADNNGASKWAVYKNSKVYASSEIDYPLISNVAVTSDGKTFAIIDDVGIKISLKQAEWTEYQVIRWSDISAATQLSITTADAVCFSDDGNYLVISNNQGYVVIYQRSTSADYQYNTYKSYAAAAGSKLAISNKNSVYTVAVTSTNKVYTWTSTAWNGGLSITSSINIANIVMSIDGTYLIISDPTDNSNRGRVLVYKYISNAYVCIDNTAGQPTDRLGASIAITDTGNYLAIGIPGKNNNQGAVSIYEFDSGISLYQELSSIKNEAGAEYGSKLFFMNNDETLVVFSEKGNFDDSTYVDAGRVDIYDSYNTKFIYSESLEAFSDELDNYGDSIAVGNNTILATAPLNGTGKLFSYIKASGTKSWTILHEETLRPNVDKIKKAFLYNRSSNQLVSYLDIVDPIQGRIPGPADQEIKYKTYFDPATYSVGTTSVNVDTGMNWTTAQKGMLWWDLTRAKFLENQGGTSVYKSTTWNKLYETASIDIYEWVETKYSPSEWDKLADTEKGLSLGISGLSKYGNSVYSLRQRYDNISKQFTNIYYFWVKNSKIVPNVPGRVLSASDVSLLISDPSGYGYPCLALTGSNSFTLVNITNLLSDTDINLNVQYWLIDNQEINNHSQWKVISENVSTIIPREIEKKWFHSLIGKDDSDRTVPDFKLPVKQRYGVEFRPRQSMFVNRAEALKQFIERVNSALAKELIVDDFDLTALNQSEPSPSAVAGSWDSIIDFETELQFVGTASLVQAQFTPVITNGILTNVIINNPGSGYVNSPHLRIIGTGTNASAKAVVDNTGKVSKVEILDGGSGYSDDTMIVIRPYAVLVNSDATAFDKWSIYQWDKVSKSWNKTKSQSYDVTKFWNYIDWYQPGYNQFTKIDHIVENTYELVTAEVNIGEIVKVKNIGTGGWLLLEKFDNNVTIDYTQNYKVVGRQHGTIQFVPSLYNFDNTVIGFDNQLFDGGLYDNFAAKELRIILDAIKNDILIDNLRQEYLNLFFASIRYVLHEQLLTDWVMKTSFVKAIHNVGELKEKVTYNNDNLANFEDYVNEVKPFRTKVRDYVSSYTKLDTAQQSVTDFDLIPVIDLNSSIVPLTVAVSDTGEIQASSSEIASYPWKHWYDHVGFKIISLDIVDGGSGYIGRPVVKITGGFGTGAEAKAYISNGKVNRIEIISAGTGYLKTPTITLDGGLSATGTPARVVAVIESEVVRSNKISIKFDRITRNYYVTELTESETFVGTGSRLQFALKWSPVASVGDSVVTVDGVDALRNEYTLSTKKSTARGYTSYSGVLTFNTAPKTGASIVITYKKNFEHLTAADRINFYYSPTTGQLGKDLAQLMTGIDYGGVQITGLGFNISGGWDSLPWFSDSWDGFDAEFDDYIVTVGDSTYSYTLPYTPVAGEQINIYVNGTRIDDPYFNVYDGSTIQPNGRKVAPAGVVMQTFVGDGSTKVITLPNLTSPTPIDINEGDKVIFRKSTSDGSFISTSEEIDTQLQGGSFVGTSLTSATGYAPDDINVDGELFVTPSTSYAPEEIVPGQIFDTVAIKVFHRPAGGAPRILFKNYVADGTTDTFIIGQQFPSDRSVIVKIGNLIIEQDQYNIDWVNNSVTLNTIPNDKEIVSIISFSFNSQTILDLDYFVADGSTLEFITRAPWSAANLQSTVLVNGNVVSYELFSADETYEIPGNVGIRFAESVEPGSIINYMIDVETGDSSVNNTSSVAKSQTIIFDGSTQTYSLSNLGADVLPGYGLKPYDTNVIVRVGQQILKPSNVLYFTLTDDTLIYEIPSHKFAPYTIDSNDIRVYIDGEQLTPGSDYVLDLADISITLSNLVYTDNAKLAIVIDVGYEYVINDNGTITFVSTYPSNTEIEVISFYNHVLLDIDRTTDTLTPSASLVPNTPDTFKFSNKLGGRFELRRPVLAADYVWIVKNGTLLTHSVDYILLGDRLTIQMTDNLLATDVVQVLSFGNNVIQAPFGFMQFKDMLNRTHYKRINKEKSSRLARDLLQTDITIEVLDGSVFTDPNKNLNLPGVVEINGERIEYFTKTGNILGQLRRGTLGTGVPTTHVKDLIVLDIGSTETIPYTDKTVVITAISDGSTKNIGLNYVPKVVNPIASQENKDVVDVFVGGYRLKKDEYKLFKESNDQPYSPEGDTTLVPDFTTDGINYGTEVSPIGYIRLAEAPRENEKIVVVKKTGHVWNEDNKQLVDSNNAIANFLRSVEPVWPEFLTDKYRND